MILPQRGGIPAAGECHVWLLPITDRPEWLPLLDSAERDRLEQLMTASGRQIFVSSRAAQRLILGRYLDLPPESVGISRACRFCGDPGHGRPDVGDRLSFNASHTSQWLAVAVVGSGVVGLDIEAVPADRDHADLARRVLVPQEHEAYERLPVAHRPAHFIRQWTRKEAVLKLTGLGLAEDATGLAVSGPTIGPPEPGRPGWPPGPIHLYDLPGIPDHRGALATTVPVSQIRWCGPVPER